MKKAYVVTVGCKRESLGALKLATWLRRQRWNVIECTTLDWKDDPAELYCFSVVFSWKLPEMVTMAKWATSRGEVWIGGPAVTFSVANRRYVEQQTGIKPHVGIDQRFEEESGDFHAVYFSRGCPAYTPACGTCPVPFIEGNKFTFYWGAQPAKLLLDNNLSALPDDYQDYIVWRYSDWPHKSGLVDCNSGFEPHTFTEQTLLRWKQFPLQCWRFGYDDLTERDEALEMMRLLKANGYSGEKVRVYTLIGNEPIDACIQRMTEVISWGMHPWPQRLRPLDWLGPDGTLPCRHDWDEPTLIAYQRFYSYRAFWARLKPEEFWYQGRYPLDRSDSLIRQS